MARTLVRAERRLLIAFWVVSGAALVVLVIAFAQIRFTFPPHEIVIHPLSGTYYVLGPLLAVLIPASSVLMFMMRRAGRRSRTGDFSTTEL
jgi:hypothetical protein